MKWNSYEGVGIWSVSILRRILFRRRDGWSGRGVRLISGVSWRGVGWGLVGARLRLDPHLARAKANAFLLGEWACTHFQMYFVSAVSEALLAMYRFETFSTGLNVAKIFLGVGWDTELSLKSSTLRYYHFTNWQQMTNFKNYQCKLSLTVLHILIDGKGRIKFNHWGHSESNRSGTYFGTLAFTVVCCLCPSSVK